MWLCDFLSKDLPYCRTMIYGYDSKLSAYTVNTVMDYGRGLMEELKLARKLAEVCYPTDFVGISSSNEVFA
jgi:hypothetical protein